MVPEIPGLAALERMGGATLVRQVAEAFKAHVPAQLFAARSALKADDLESVFRAAHSINASSGQLGASALQEVAEDVEHRARAGKRDGLGELVDRMHRQYEAFVVVLNAALRPLGLGEPERLVAVVEDNPDNRLLLKAILAPRYRILEVADGADALRRFRQHTPDLVIMDISLPGMDGVEVLNAMRQDPGLRSIPAIALTAHAMVGDREKYLGAGFDDYLTKPILEEAPLLEAIATVLSARA